MKKLKKILIYDKWLKTVGGGEKVATVMAEVLSKAGYRVEILTNYSVKKDFVEKKMGVDLSKVKIKVVYERAYAKLTEYTKNYDLMINVSFLDGLPSSAKKSIYYTMFPSPVKNTLFGFIKYEKILPFLRNFLIIPEIEGGFDIPDEVIVRSGKWMSRKNRVIIHNSPSVFRLNLKFYAESLTPDMLRGVKTTSKNSKITIIDKSIDHQTSILSYRFQVETQKSSTVEILVGLNERVYRRGLGLVSLTVNSYRYFLWNVMKRYIPRYEMALYGSSDFKPGLGLGTYDLFLSDSKFTKKWSKKYWSKDSQVLYPPVDVHEFMSGSKDNIILSVGRFFISGHSKRQDVMIDAYKRGVDSGKITSSWEFHLVGGVGTSEQDVKYFEDITKSTKDYKIFIHQGIDFSDLKSLYARTKIYWHAAGYGVNENRTPIQMEHFGITPVEAMAAGCVPVVYRGGGLIETVTPDSGFTWKTTDELIESTHKVIQDETLRKKLSKSAQKRSKTFSRENFARGLLEHVELLI